jgi:hypothetical protein
MLNIRPLTYEDYDDTLKAWWADWGWTAPTRDFLPDDGVGGIMVLDEDEPICAGFMYATNSRVSWVEWIISNKQYRKKPQREEAIKLLVSTLTEISKNLGNKYCYALIKHQSLIETYKELGYTKGDEYVGEMIKII